MERAKNLFNILENKLLYITTATHWVKSLVDDFSTDKVPVLETNQGKRNSGFNRNKIKIH